MFLVLYMLFISNYTQSYILVYTQSNILNYTQGIFSFPCTLFSNPKIYSAEPVPLLLV
jgi:hypothetical protein